jgi:hypothetical protein
VVAALMVSGFGQHFNFLTPSRAFSIFVACSSGGFFKKNVEFTPGFCMFNRNSRKVSWKMTGTTLAKNIASVVRSFPVFSCDFQSKKGRICPSFLALL